MRVLVIPEDFRKDQYILKPLVEAMLSDAGRPRAKVVVCRDPLLGGISRALSWPAIQEIVERYRGMVDLFLLCVDRDGKAGRRQQLDRLEANARELLDSTEALFAAENAWQELEVWVLAGHTLPADWVWNEIRSEIDVKERYFEPFAKVRGLLRAPGGGRRTLALEAAQRFARIRAMCPEDVAVLHCRVRRWLSDPAGSAADAARECREHHLHQQE